MFKILYFDRVTCLSKADGKLKEELKDFIRKRTFLSLHDFPSLNTPDLTKTDLVRRLAEILGKKKNPNSEESISPILPFPRLG